MAFRLAFTQPRHVPLERPAPNRAPSYAAFALGVSSSARAKVTHNTIAVRDSGIGLALLPVASLLVTDWLHATGRPNVPDSERTKLVNAARDGLHLAEAEIVSKAAVDGHIDKAHAANYALLRKPHSRRGPAGADFLFDVAYYCHRTGTRHRDLIRRPDGTRVDWPWEPST